MRVLVVGSGAREHAIAWKLRGSQVHGALGNPGIGEIATLHPVKETDFEGLISIIEREGIDFTIIGGEDPLIGGVVDVLEARGHLVLGPSSQAALNTEGSKALCKEMLLELGIPTARAAIFDDPDKARAYVFKEGVPIVIKASGPARGKGVKVCKTFTEAIDWIEKLMLEKIHDESGEVVIIEEYLVGQEVSVFALVSGEEVLMLEAAVDYKLLKGKMTGGVASYSPVISIDLEALEFLEQTIFRPIALSLVRKGIPYKGFLYAGLMKVGSRFYVLELNCRLGDPEAQVLLPRLQTDLTRIAFAVIEDRLQELRGKIKWSPQSAVGVVLCSEGYPDHPIVDRMVWGVEKAKDLGALVFQAGTKKVGQSLLTSGGRVLTVVGLGRDYERARGLTYSGVEVIRFEGKQFRRDAATV